MSYLESAEGLRITKARMLAELKDHNILDELAEFYYYHGEHDFYDATTVLEFIGY